MKDKILNALVFYFTGVKVDFTEEMVRSGNFTDCGLDLSLYRRAGEDAGYFDEAYDRLSYRFGEFIAAPEFVPHDESFFDAAQSVLICDLDIEDRLNGLVSDKSYSNAGEALKDAINKNEKETAEILFYTVYGIVEGIKMGFGKYFENKRQEKRENEYA